MRNRKLPAKTIEGFILLLAYNFSLNMPISIESNRITFVIKRADELLIDSIKLNPCNKDIRIPNIVKRGKRPLKNGFHFSPLDKIKKSLNSKMSEIKMIPK
jgi:hypothetical protein